MSHNINTYIGRQSAWHQLGTVTGKYLTWGEILAHGGLDFQVFKSQLQDGLGRKVPAYGTFRWNNADRAVGNKDAATFLGVVGEDYKVIPHSTGFELMDAIMRTSDGAHYETAGVLGTGSVVWGLADVGLTIKVGDDKQIPYLFFGTSHDGSYSWFVKMCNTRVVCNNTFDIAIGERVSSMFRVRHTKNANSKIQDAHKALSAFSDEVKTVEQKLQFLATRRMTRESMQSIFNRLFP